LGLNLNHTAKGSTMIFGSISYLNLLPFQVFLTKYLKNSTSKMAFRYNRAVPSKINKSLIRGKVNAAFISSIHSRRFNCTDVGIVSHKKVYSVFAIPDEVGDDPASETSNTLAKVLNVDGKILIGDEALKYYLDTSRGIDLSQEWYDQTGLPFVFARLCYNKHGKEIEKLAKLFVSKKTKIPQYILKREAKKREISPKALLWYLEHIHYKLDYKAKHSLKLFLKMAKRSI